MAREKPHREWWRRGSVLTLTLIVAVQLVRSFPVSIALATTALILTLTGVVYATFRDGIRAGLASAALIAAYTLHVASPPGMLIALTRATVESATLMFAIGAVMAAVIALLKRRVDAGSEERVRAERRHAESVESSNRALREANATLEAFTFVVSHDLKEPVRAVEAYLRYLDEDHGHALPADGREVLERARRESARLRDLLQGLLEFSRVAAGDLPTEVIAPTEVLTSGPCRAAFDTLVRERQARVDVQEDLPPVLGAHTVLSQVLGNLVSNAIEHNASATPQVRVHGRRTGSSVEIMVDDNGAGFPDHLVDRFHDLMEMPPSGRRGFGLIIARRGVERMNGEMTLGHAENAGGRAIIRLPAADERAPRADAPRRDAPREPGTVTPPPGA